MLSENALCVSELIIQSDCCDTVGLEYVIYYMMTRQLAYAVNCLLSENDWSAHTAERKFLPDVDAELRRGEFSKPGSEPHQLDPT